MCSFCDLIPTSLLLQLEAGRILKHLLWSTFSYEPTSSTDLVLAHLEPELELFEVNDIGDDGDDDLYIAPLSPMMDRWMDVSYPLDCYDYKSTCGAYKHYN